ncbi:MAG: hypothetical protein FK734_18255 [Asgard group archaeon]|nr:hypothetical protein [Asgard group archaeon]
MPYENCEQCQRCSPCPVTTADKEEGAYPITHNTGDSWYCTNCFYCEDACPDLSPRQYAITRRRTEDQNSERMIEPLEKIQQIGTLFELTPSINNLRQEHDLPILPEINLTELAILYKSVLGEEYNIKEIISEEPSREKLRQNNENKKVKIALFLGCLIPYRVLDYELSARSLLQKMTISFIDLPFSCCGSTMTESKSEELWLVIAAYNLALAKENNIETIIALCGGCSGNLRRVNQMLLEDKEKLALVNKHLASIKKNYNCSVTIKHLSEFLQEKENLEKLDDLLKNQSRRNLKQLSVAVQIPCQVIRPKEYSPSAALGSDLLINLLTKTSIKVIHYPFETLCCGSSMLPYDEEIAYSIAKKRIESLKKRKVDALILGCGNCSMNYNVHQSEYNKGKKIISLFFTEILDYAIGGKNTIIEELLKKKRKKN